MHVQLRNDVAERGDVEFVGFEHCFERTTDEVDFAEQGVLIALVEIDELARASDARHENQPRKSCIVHQHEA